MSLLAYAEKELRREGLFDEDSDYGGMIGPAVMEIMEVFSKQGHSGFSAGIVTSIVEKLMRYEPLSALTGADDEWVEVGEGLFQNNRCGNVFKKDGVAYNSTGIVFREPNGACFTSSESRVIIQFPYVPIQTIQERPADVN